MARSYHREQPERPLSITQNPPPWDEDEPESTDRSPLDLFVSEASSGLSSGGGARPAPVDPLAAFAVEAPIETDEEAEFDAVIAAFASARTEVKAPLPPPPLRPHPDPALTEAVQTLPQERVATPPPPTAPVASAPVFEESPPFYEEEEEEASPPVSHYIPDLPAIAAQPRLPIADAESEEPATPRYRPIARFTGRDAAVIALCLVGVAELGWLGWRLGRGTAAATPTAAAPAVTTAGRDTTPDLRAPLSLGDAASASAAGAKPATLAIRTDPADALVLVDGTLRGRSPITLSDLTPGAHTIVLSRLPHFAERVVTLRAGESSALVLTLPATSSTGASPPTRAPAASPAAAAAAAATPRPIGWLSVKSDVPVELFVRGRRVGASSSGRVPLVPGRHEIEAVNTALGIRARETVVIVAGRGATMAVAAPPGTVNINALPWASVSIDGAAVGDTPLANLRLAAGQHEVVFTHPELGERRLTITVPSGAPTRVTTDLRKK